MSNDKLCKRYLFNLEMIVKDKAAANKKIEGPPRMLYLRELYASIHQIFKEQVLAVVRSSPDGCCPPLPRRPPTHPPPPPTRACASAHTRLLPGASRHHGRRTIAHVLAAGRPAPRSTHQSTPTSHAQSSRPPARAPHEVHGHCPELLTHIPMRTNDSPPSTGLTILAGAHRRDLKRCWLATNAC